jgi:hypothetical protein
MWEGRGVDHRRAIITTLIALTIAGCGGSGDNGGSGSGVSGSSEAISLPAQLGEFRDVADVTSEKAPDAGAKQRTHQDDVRTATAAAYSKAYGGAGATYRGYSNSGLDLMPWVIAVRAESPGLTVGPVVDPAYLKLAKPEHEIKDFGDVSCELFWNTVLEGEEPKPDDETVVRCQRSGSGVTVLVGGNGFKGPDGEQAMVDLTNAAFDAVSG